MNKIRIAIVGAGMAGIQVLGAYLKSSIPLEIHIFDTPKRAGYGKPFIPDDWSLLLNQPKQQMSLTDNDKDYEQWIQKNYPSEAEERFTSRWRFGEYSHTLFSDYIKDKRVKYHATLISDLGIDGEQFVLTDEVNTKHLFDVVHLCFGQMPYSKPYNLTDEDGYYADPYPLSEKEDKILNSKNIGIIGCGLSSVDFFVYLKSHNYFGQIYFLVNDQKFPIIRGKELNSLSLPSLDKVYRKKNIRLDDIINAFHKDAKYFNISLKDFIPKENGHPLDELIFQKKNIEKIAILEYMVLKYHDNYPRVWNNFTLEEQNKFAENYLDTLQLIKSPMPLKSALKIIDALQKKEALIIPYIKRITKKRKYFDIETTTQTLKIETILNGTGPVFHPKDAGHKASILPLVKSLLNQRILQHYNGTCFEVTFPDLSVISQRYGILKKLKLHGQTISGINLPNNDIGLIGKAARNAVADILRTYKTNS